mmetsp:Transcript_67227/g.185213  ORF Transcript_67227/g.185213 Transcript_67227/m.185213 type:complete len:227 (+) Transcript_67227:414-1094(+)
MQKSEWQETPAFSGPNGSVGRSRSPTPLLKGPNSTSSAGPISNETVSGRSFSAHAATTVGGSPGSGVADPDLDELIDSVMDSPGQTQQTSVMEVMPSKSDGGIEGLEMDSVVTKGTNIQRSQPKRAFEEGVEESKGGGVVESKASTPTGACPRIHQPPNSPAFPCVCCPRADQVARGHQRTHRATCARSEPCERTSIVTAASPPPPCATTTISAILAPTLDPPRAT